MRSFVIHGVDDQSGAVVQLPVTLGSVGEAADFAARRGVRVTEVHAESGHVYYPDTGGGFRRDDEARREPSPDAALLVIAFLVPVVGIVAGSIRLSKRDASGTRVLLLAIAGAIVWGVVLAALAKGG